jgi:heme oxygenase
MTPDTAATARDLFFSELRTQTAPQHEALENTSLSRAIVSDALQEAQYVHYLKTMYLFAKPFESSCFSLLGGVFSNLGERSRTAALESDLRHFGIDPASLLRTGDFNFETPVSVEEAAGAMYVMEGSTLGGRVILKNLQNKLGDMPSGTSYFQGYGADTGKKWKLFLDELWSYAANCNQQAIYAGAVKTFSNLHGLFSKQDAHAV